MGEKVSRPSKGAVFLVDTSNADQYIEVSAARGGMAVSVSPELNTLDLSRMARSGEDSDAATYKRDRYR